jgi:hypothetical protein
MPVEAVLDDPEEGVQRLEVVKVGDGVIAPSFLSINAAAGQTAVAAGGVASGAQ